MLTDFQQVTVERLGSAAVITMVNEARRNALSLAMMRELMGALAACGGDASVRAVILAGKGAAFCAGHDLRELRGRGERDYVEIFDTCVALMKTMETISQPVIAEVGAMATAAGAQLVASCDLAVASTQARFATPGVRIGLFCSTPMVAISRAIGRKRALEMLLTGDAIDAATALDWGLVNRVVPQEDLRATSLIFAEKIAEASAPVVGLGKAAFYAQIALDTDAAYAYTKDVMVRNAQLADAQEGIAAFVEKRPPKWPSVSG
jgi:enoyl-CoA hydratase/carnithine racemase